MEIYSTLKNGNSIEVLADSVVQYIIAKSQQKSLQIILQLLLDMMKISHRVTIEDCEQESFENILSLNFELNFLQKDLRRKDFTYYDIFITNLFKLMPNADFIDAPWLQKFIVFLLQLRRKIHLEAVVSRLSLPVFISLTEIYFDLNKEVNAYLENLNRGAFSQRNLPHKQLEFEKKSSQIRFLDEFCDALHQITLQGLRYNYLSSHIVKEMCNLYEREPTFYLKSERSLIFYVKCWKIKSFEVTHRALTSIKTILINGELDDEEKDIIISFLAQEEPSRILCCLTVFESSVQIVKNSLQIINEIHERVPQIMSWKMKEYDQIYLKMFHNNLSIRKLVAKLFLKQCSKRANHNGDLLIEIVEFYFRFKSSSDELVGYIDTLWSFEYMKDFNNICALYNEEEGNSDSQLLTSHFIVAMIKRMLQQFDQYKENILTLLKKLPLLFNALKNSISPYAILLEVLMYVDLNLYDPRRSGHEKYQVRLLKSLSNTFEDNIDCYVLLKNIFYILNKFYVLNFGNARQQVNFLVEGTYNKFLETITMWELRDFQTDDEMFKKLMGNIYKMSIVVSHVQYLGREHDEEILGKLNISNIITEHFSRLSQQFTEGDRIEAIAIKLMSDLLKRKIFKILKQDADLFPQIDMLKEDAKSFISFLLNAITRENMSLFFAKHAFEALIYVMLATQKTLAYSPYNQIKALVIDVNPEQYFVIINFVYQIISDINGNTDLPILEVKKNILKNFISLHQKHIGLPFSPRVWRVVIYLGFIDVFEDEISQLIKALLKYETSGEEKGARFCKIFGIILYNLGEKEITIKRVQIIIRKYSDLLRDELHTNEKKIILSASILTLCDMLSKKLDVTEISENVNRLKILKCINPLIHELDRKHKIRIKNELNILNKVLVRQEFKTLKHFENLLK